MEEENKNLSNKNNESENTEPVAKQPAEQPAKPSVEPSVEPVAEQPAEQPAVSGETIKDPVDQDLIAKGKWFVIQVMTGDEDKVKQALELTIKLRTCATRFFRF